MTRLGSLADILAINCTDLAVGCGLLPGQTDEESAGRLRRVSLEELEHVSAGLGDCSHLGDDWEVMDDKANLVLLVAGKGLSVAKKTEAYKKNSEIAGEWNIYAQNTFSETRQKNMPERF